MIMTKQFKKNNSTSMKFYKIVANLAIPVIIFTTSMDIEYTGREAVKGHHTGFFYTQIRGLMSIVHCDFDKGSRNQHFQSTPLCMLLRMLTILNDP